MNAGAAPAAIPAKKRLAIVGGGSSGLISLKTALDVLPDWEVVCLEKTGEIMGCWGYPYPGFVSTSTKYTTQFSCYPLRDASVEPDGGRSRAEFYREGEYGDYLNRFADRFQLRRHILLHRHVVSLVRSEGGGWSLTYRPTSAHDTSSDITERFDAVVICTGLAAQIKEIDSAVPVLSLSELNAPNGIANIRQQRIVVFGGGESAVDYATRLSQPELGNQVYLSLRSGVRVSPRYHPIRGVPSDFLRNRLMLSIDPALRNWIGQRFVEARILHQERFEKWFPARRSSAAAVSSDEQPIHVLRKQWAYRLTKAAKDELFNMFHNKSDDFLEFVAQGRITIVGPPVDAQMERFYQFDSTQTVTVQPTRILPAIGYRSTLSAILGTCLSLTDFYLGCCHVQFPDLFLVGFARPIIGNIPSISEMQAAYVCQVIAGKIARPEQIVELNERDRQANAGRFAKLDLNAMYPVEMFTYCDALARDMNSYPSLWSLRSLRKWWRLQLTPATTMHYQFHDPAIRQFAEQAPVYMPLQLVGLLLLLKPVDWTYRAVRWAHRRLSLPRK